MKLDIPGVKRVENYPRQDLLALCSDMTHAVYPHAQIYGEHCTLQTHIKAPADEVFEYLARTESLLEWTYGLRDLRLHRAPDLYRFTDHLAPDGQTRCFCRTVSHPQAMTVDHHCAWDQADHLWMIDLMRVVSAPLVLGRPGCIVLWTHCHHPNYAHNPYPETAVPGRQFWIGDAWPLRYATHTVALENLKRIAETRHALGLPLVPLGQAEGADA